MLRKICNNAKLYERIPRYIYSVNIAKKNVDSQKYVPELYNRQLNDEEDAIPSSSMPSEVSETSENSQPETQPSN